ncbi:nucleic acid dioxygenase ALKBH1-like [Montipora foliosa]|uniref:nucleic acid dioxygenase ALKBH1-like n=1 Tax=Montipora foliosa TaxID=591990 RepID=UPI0035F1C2B0
MADTNAKCGDDKVPTRQVDYVREEYKRYKKKKPPPDFSEVIDFRDSATFRGRVEKLELKKRLHSKFGLSCSSEWRAYKLVSCPGFMYIVNPFLSGAQQYWSLRCMLDFPRKPNVCNLDAHLTLDPSKSVWEASNDENSDLMDRLRWVHLGYHFDYNVVDYRPEKYYDFPLDLAGLTQHIATAIGYSDYFPEAGIVNYYPLGGSMGGHTDHYESDLSWPLISLSFGQSAIFLIGGATRDVRPSALYVHSGDILIMSGESRTAFHAVPRIIKIGEENEPPACLKWKKRIFDNLVNLETQDGLDAINNKKEIKDVSKSKAMNVNNRNLSTTTTTTSNCEGNGESEIQELFAKPNEVCECNEVNFCGNLTRMNSITPEEWRKIEVYLSKTRINVNVRQVHEKGKTVDSFCL